MVAYSFSKQFVPAVQAGLEPGAWVPGMKRHTLRGQRKRHAGFGDRVDLYTGMRTRHCRLIGRAHFVIRMPVDVGWIGERFYLARGPGEALLVRGQDSAVAPLVLDMMRWPVGRQLDEKQARAFALMDGFADLIAMEAFFATERPRIEDGCFELTLIGWAPELVHG